MDRFSDALDCLRQATYDAVLIDLDLPDGDTPIESFNSISTAAKSSAVVVMINEEDEHLANRLLHEGAQDVLLKSKIEPEALANSIQCAGVGGGIRRPDRFVQPQGFRDLCGT